MSQRFYPVGSPDIHPTYAILLQHDRERRPVPRGAKIIGYVADAASSLPLCCGAQAVIQLNNGALAQCAGAYNGVAIKQASPDVRRLVEAA